MGHPSMNPAFREVGPWNEDRLIGAKRALKQQQVWATRFWLDQQKRLRDRALFDFPIDSKLRSGGLVRVHQAKPKPLLRGEIANKAGEDAPGGAFRLANRQFHREAGTICALSNQDAAGADNRALASRQIPLDIAIMPASVIRGCEQSYVAADYLMFRIAEYPLHCRTGRVNYAPFGDYDLASGTVVKAERIGAARSMTMDSGAHLVVTSTIDRPCPRTSPVATLIGAMVTSSMNSAPSPRQHQSSRRRVTVSCGLKNRC